MNDLIDVVKEFNINGNVLDIFPYGNGLINKTYKIVTDKNNYLLQELNTSIFLNPVGIMENIEKVTNHIKIKTNKTLNLINTKDNKIYLNYQNRYFRIYDFIENSKSFSCPISNDSLKNISYYYGQFISLLSDFNSLSLYESIPNFHNTVDRFKIFKSALDIDKFSRADKCYDEIQYLLNNSKYAPIIVDALNNKEIPYRVIHNDTKIDNILVDDKNNLLAVIDLDTLMPGSLLFDFGDLCRSSLLLDNNESYINLDTFKTVVEGFYNATKNIITNKEINLLAISVYIITYELSLRFLSDYLSGDIYFKSKYDRHNLDRAKKQITLCKSIYKNLDIMNNIVNDICNN